MNINILLDENENILCEKIRDYYSDLR